MPDADPGAAGATAHEPPHGEATRDRASFRLAVFGAVLVIVLSAGYGVGRLSEGMPSPGTARLAAGASPAAGPAAGGHAADGHAGAGATGGDDTGTTPAAGGHAADGHAGAGADGHDDTGADGHDDTGATPQSDGPAAPADAPPVAGEAVGGLALTAQGLTVVPERTMFPAGTAQDLAFRITGPGGAPITTYAVVHDKPLHLIVVRRDLSGYQHLHPTMAPDGTWRVPLTLAAPGSYRAVADFTAVVGGRQVAATLGADLTVAGNYAPAPPAAPVRQAVTGDFQVAYEGEPRTGSTQPLLFTVTTRGRPAALQPYLGAHGHLVVLREGDVGYVHVHPEAALVDGRLKFWLAAPGPGRYRMFLDFQVGGTVHTAAWTVQVR